MGHKATGTDTMGSNGMKNARLHTTGLRAFTLRVFKLREKGFTLIASLLMLLLLSGIAIGLMLMVNTEGKVGGTDLQNNLAFHAAEGGIEKMATDLASTFNNAQSPSASQICGVQATANQPTLLGVNWTVYSISAPGITCTGSTGTGTPTATWGQISAGPNQGLWAQIIPVSMQANAAMFGQQEVSMTRGAQVALIPVFQFGVFCEGDCGFFDSPNLTFAGRVHTNADLYLGVASGYTLTFNNKLEAYGNVVTEVLPNGLNSATFNDTGTVYIPTAVGGCSTPTTNCTTKATNGGSAYGDGSVQGAGGDPAQSTYNTTIWNTFSKTTTNSMLINGNYGSKTLVGTGAKKLSMPFVAQGAQPYQIIRRSLSTDSTALSQSREYNLAQIHVLLSDDPADLPGGSGDSNNIRLANVPANSSGTGYNLPYGITMTSGNYLASLPSPSPNTYNLYFATASNAMPSGTCASSGGATTCPVDWPYPPAPWTAAMMSAVGAGTDPNCVLLCPTGAPFVSNNGTTIAGSSTLSGAGASTTVPPALTLCPTATMTYTGSGGGTLAPLSTDVPANCTTAGAAAFPYYLTGGSTTFTETTTESQMTGTWNLIDGWLRVEYKDASGNWHPVTSEWLQLGFARGLAAPTLPGSSSPAAGTNPINPNAILLLQEPADRVSSGNVTASVSTTETAPVCTAKSKVGGTYYCTAWAITPAQVLVDTAGGTVWQFGSTTTAENGAPASSTLPLESLSRFNWYPINFYDAREGEPRDVVWSNTYPSDASCTSNGIMNAVEIDVGNLKRWLAGSIGSTGTSVDYATQNGYILYFSDRRGMLPNPNVASGGGANFVKTGDSGLEDVINANGAGDGAAGTPDGALEPIPAGKTVSPEDVNLSGVLDNYGTDNLGLGFYGTGTNGAINLNYFIVAANPNDPFGTASYNSRIANCGTARKNWVSGARHVLKLVDGAFGNVPLVPGGTLADPGGFTVASENPTYVQGDYNSNSADPFWSGGADLSGHAAASVIADAVTMLSDSWVDQQSTLGNPSSGGNNSPTLAAGNRSATTTYYRLAVAGGKNLAFPFPAWENNTDYGFGTDGGVHNFLRFLEDWNSSGATLNYGGSLVSLYYATYGTGVFKCCAYSVYQPPTRNYIFDTDFTSPSGLPPGTPLFRDVESLSYWQLFAPRTNSN